MDPTVDPGPHTAMSDAYPDTSALPDDFQWGVATSAYQVEGAAREGGRSPSIWDTFCDTPGRVKDGSTGTVATDHYHRFLEDVELMSWLGVDAYRFSIAWPRIVPDGVGAANPSGISFYRRLATALRDAGIEPVATLYHWDLPASLQDRGGWENPASVDWFAGYAAVAKDALGDLVTTWTTINEPYCAAFLGHGSGVHAPGVVDASAAYVAAHNLLLAHHAAVDALRANPTDADRIGAVLNIIPARPASDADDDRRVAGVVEAIHNRLFIQGTLRGTYPEVIAELHARFDVADRVDANRLIDARRDIDFLGVNYYNVNRFRHDPEAPGLPEFPGADGAVLVPPTGTVTDMGWGVEPSGLGDVLDLVAAESPDLPLAITENGAAFPDDAQRDGIVDDGDRIDYLAGHIAEVAAASARGIDVRGYFAWSLLDNFEWSLGYSKRFGIVHVDFDSLTRTPKRSAGWYRDLIAGYHRARRPPPAD